MKKIIIALLALVYLSSSTGATVRMHYCMGKLVDWRLGNNKSKTCARCGMEKSDEKNSGCCKDEHKFIKNNIDHKTVETGFLLLHQFGVVMPVSFVEILSFSFSSVTEENPISHAPPRSSGVAVYIRNCIFLI